MYLELDGRGPLYVQLTRALKEAILGGRFSEGGKLPPSRFFAREIGVSRNTVLTAYEQLRAEGFVIGKIGSGSYVAAPVRRTAAGASRPETVRPQSNYARRGRVFHDHENSLRSSYEEARYKFQYGMPLVDPALSNAWGRALVHAAAYTSPNYPPAQGLLSLRESVCDYLARRRGIVTQPEDVIVVSGTQQAVALSIRILLDEGDDAVIEEPQYFAFRQLLQLHGARITAVPVDAQGLRCDLLPHRPPRLIFVTPSHQFPGGSVLSMTRRMELLRYASRHQSWILEDDYDGEFRYDSLPLAALRSLDDEDRVIYMGTFSKSMFPSLRLGYAVIPRALRQDFVTAKWANDLGCSAVEQAAVASFIKSGGFERHLRRSARILRQRREVLIEGLLRHGKGKLRIADSHAGMHLVAWFDDKNAADVEALVALGKRHGLGLYSILPHYHEPPNRCGIVFGYSNLSVSEIREAVVLFGHCMNEFYPDMPRIARQPRTSHID